MACNGTGGRRHLISSTDTSDHATLGALRRELRARRRAIAPIQRRLADQAIVRHLRTLPAYRRALHLALYWPADGEADVLALEAHARARGKSLYLPVVGRAGAMSFAAWPPGTRFRKNRYGIPEPVGTRRVPARRLDLLVIPLVGFDAGGRRLGMGGGYYDRALAGPRGCTVLVGAAYACQQVASLPLRPWDVPLDFVITERGRGRRCRAPMRAQGGNAS
jgi:5-formyltetrahydrofolate cyclo-ligase